MVRRSRLLACASATVGLGLLLASAPPQRAVTTSLAGNHCDGSRKSRTVGGSRANNCVLYNPPSLTPTPTATATATPTLTPTATPTAAPAAAPTATPTPSPTASPTPTPNITGHPR